MDDRFGPVTGSEDCRSVIELFLQTDADTLSLHELSTRLVSERERQERRRLRLHHHILPKLEETGIVEYDWHSHDVRFRGDRAELRTVTATVDETLDAPSGPRN